MELTHRSESDLLSSVKVVVTVRRMGLYLWFSVMAIRETRIAIPVLLNALEDL